uniref:aromatic amino acid lyase n=1 Tax=Desulfococcus sp. TaxID=2025834 RepID=UPI00359335CD
MNDNEGPVEIRGEGMTLADVVRVSRRGARVRLTEDPAILSRVGRSRQIILDAVAAGDPIYGVTTVFGGMANILIPKEEALDLQNNIPWPHKTGAGARLPAWAVR